MTTPLDPSKLAQTAADSPAESTEEERGAVGEEPDTGGLVSPDHAQSGPEPS